jgi:outer membrane protein OmpA-like peptidoglycan-associated protein
MPRAGIDLALPQQRKISKMTGETVMTHVTSALRRSVYLHVCALAMVVGLMPRPAAAQTLPQVRVVADREISTFRHFDDEDYLITTAAAGTVLEVIFTEGDAFRHLDSNWYWVLLPRDQWGTKRAGWISGRHVQPVPAAPRAAPATSAPAAEAPRAPAAVEPPSLPEAAPAAAPVADASAPPEFAPVMVHFAFDKSDLSEAAKTTIAEAVASLKSHAATVTFVLEGHADATGRETYNEKLGQARAERVKQHLAAEYEIAVEKISVVSYGETQPAGSNATREGRAQNRRVVIKISR